MNGVMRFMQFQILGNGGTRMLNVPFVSKKKILKKFSGTLGASLTITGVTYNFQFAICSPLSLPGGCPNFDDTNHSACYEAPHMPGGPLVRNNPAVCMTYPVTTHQQPPVASFGTNCLGQYATSGPAA